MDIGETVSQFSTWKEAIVRCVDVCSSSFVMLAVRTSPPKKCLYVTPNRGRVTISACGRYVSKNCQNDSHIFVGHPTGRFFVGADPLSANKAQRGNLSCLCKGFTEPRDCRTIDYALALVLPLGRFLGWSLCGIIRPKHLFVATRTTRATHQENHCQQKITVG